MITMDMEFCGTIYNYATEEAIRESYDCLAGDYFVVGEAGFFELENGEVWELELEDKLLIGDNQEFHLIRRIHSQKRDYEKTW